MKMRCILALCGAMAFVLAGCGSEIVESAVTEPQVIDVNEPSAVEQAMEQQDVAFVDETESIVAFEKEYAAKAPANDKEIGEKSQQVLEAAQEQFFYWSVATDDVPAQNKPCSSSGIVITLLLANSLICFFPYLH